MALDSLYCSYLKAHHPYEFYQTLLQFHSNRGEKDKVAALKQEMQEAFDIKEGHYKFGFDNRKFVADKEHNMIQPSLLSIKGFSQSCANDLYELSKEHFDSFYDLLKRLDKVQSINKARLDILIRIGYFSEFGKTRKLLSICEFYDQLHGKKIIKKDKLMGIPEDIIRKYSTETEKQFRLTDADGLLAELCSMIPDTDLPIEARLKAEQEYLGYCSLTLPDKKDIGVVLDLDTRYSPKVTVYRLDTGVTEIIKMYKKSFTEKPICTGDVIRFYTQDKPKSKLVDGQWTQDYSQTEKWFKWWDLDILN